MWTGIKYICRDIMQMIMPKKSCIRMVLKNVLVENIVNNKDENPTAKLEYIKST